jgi:hypothetical protein
MASRSHLGGLAKRPRMLQEFSTPLETTFSLTIVVHWFIQI